MGANSNQFGCGKKQGHFCDKMEIVANNEVIRLQFGQ